MPNGAKGPSPFPTNPAIKAENAVKKWCRDQNGEDEVLLVRLLRNRGLGNEQILAVIETLKEVCTHCWACERGCDCNDVPDDYDMEPLDIPEGGKLGRSQAARLPRGE